MFWGIVQTIRTERFVLKLKKIGFSLRSIRRQMLPACRQAGIQLSYGDIFHLKHNMLAAKSCQHLHSEKYGPALFPTEKVRALSIYTNLNTLKIRAIIPRNIKLM